MEKPKKQQNSSTIRVFTYLMKQTVSPSFVFPKGGIAPRAVSSCMEALGKSYSSEPSIERIVDFCICQVYAISGFESNYMQKWNITHSFGTKAIDRFQNRTAGKIYYEDKWLKGNGLSRDGLLFHFSDKSKHPLVKFIYPAYEDRTKWRMHNSEVGFYICQIATLLWTPFSAACCECKNQARCKGITARKYAELYRIRIEEYQKSLML